MPNLRTKTWTTTTPATVADAQYWEDHLISDEDAAKASSSVQSVNGNTPDANGNVEIVALPTGGTTGQVLTKMSNTSGDADWEDLPASGHTIINASGTSMTFREGLQFLHAEVTDDSTNGKTVVDCNGEKGDKGDTGATPVITMTATSDGLISPTPSIVITQTGSAEYPDFLLAFSGFKGEKGDKGDTGETPDIVMTATTDSLISPTPSVVVTQTGSAENPEISLSLSGFKGATGNGIASIDKTSTSGLVDTYTITYTDGTTDTYTIRNGQDGQGAGDMTKLVYDSTEAVANAGGIPSYVSSAVSPKLNGRVFATATSVDGETVSFSNIDMAKGYILQAILPDGYDDAPVGMENVEITSTSGVYSVTYTVTNATVNQPFELIEIG